MACFVQIIDFLPPPFSSSCLPPVASASSLSFPPHSSGRFLFTETVGRARNRNSRLSRLDLSPHCFNTVPGLLGRSQGEDLMEMFFSQWIQSASQKTSQYKNQIESQSSSSQSESNQAFTPNRHVQHNSQWGGPSHSGLHWLDFRIQNPHHTVSSVWRMHIYTVNIELLPAAI